MKKTISIFLSILLLMSCFAVSVSAEDPKPRAEVVMNFVTSIEGYRELADGELALEITFLDPAAVAANALSFANLSYSRLGFGTLDGDSAEYGVDGNGDPLFVWAEGIDCSGITFDIFRSSADDAFYIVIAGIPEGEYFWLYFQLEADEDWLECFDAYIGQECHGFVVAYEDTDKTIEDLTGLLRKVIPLKPLWKASTWNKFERAYADAWKVAVNPLATQEEINEAYDNLAAAIELLEESDSTWMQFLHAILTFLIELFGESFADFIYDAMSPIK